MVGHFPGSFFFFFAILTKLSWPPDYFVEYLEMQYIKRRASAFKKKQNNYLHLYVGS